MKELTHLYLEESQYAWHFLLFYVYLNKNNLFHYHHNVRSIILFSNGREASLTSYYKFPI